APLMHTPPPSALSAQSGKLHGPVQKTRLSAGTQCEHSPVGLHGVQSAAPGSAFTRTSTTAHRLKSPMRTRRTMAPMLTPLFGSETHDLEPQPPRDPRSMSRL